jgi:hypothetical protein
MTTLTRSLAINISFVQHGLTLPTDVENLLINFIKMGEEIDARDYHISNAKHFDLCRWAASRPRLTITDESFLGLKQLDVVGELNSLGVICHTRFQAIGRDPSIILCDVFCNREAYHPTHPRHKYNKCKLRMRKLKQTFNHRRDYVYVWNKKSTPNFLPPPTIKLW